MTTTNYEENSLLKMSDGEPHCMEDFWSDKEIQSTDNANGL